MIDLSEKRRDQLTGPPQTIRYEEDAYQYAYYEFSRRPLFGLWVAELMEKDSRVGFGLSICNAPLFSAEVEVTGPREVAEFVERQFRRIWEHYAERILRTKIAGYGGFEVCYQEDDAGLLTFRELLDLHPRDTRPLTLDGVLSGVRVKNSKMARASGPNGQDLLYMKALWLTYRARYGGFYGYSALENAFPAWWDKNTEGGAGDLVRLRMMKDAWTGDVLYYMQGQAAQQANGNTIPLRKMAQDMAAKRASGGVLIAPMVVGQNGQPLKLIEYTPPTSIQGATQILEWIEKLDWAVLDGLNCPREVVEAAATGSGFSGRSIPFASFLSVRDSEFAGYVREIDWQILRRLVAANFGWQAAQEYEIRPVKLLETVGKQMGDFGQPNMQSGGPPQQGDGGAGGLANLLGGPDDGGQDGEQFGEFDESDHPREESGRFAKVYSEAMRNASRRVAPNKEMRKAVGRKAVAAASAHLSDEEALYEAKLHEHDIARGIVKNRPAVKEEYEKHVAERNAEKDAAGREKLRSAVESLRPLLDAAMQGKETDAERAAAAEQVLRDANATQSVRSVILAPLAAKFSEEEARDLWNKPGHGFLDYHPAAQRIRQERYERRAEERASAIQEHFAGAHELLTDAGWKLEHKSESGSRYYAKGNRKIRVADHEVPQTPEREHATANGGRSWAGSGRQLLLPARNWREQLAELMREVEDADDGEQFGLKPAPGQGSFDWDEDKHPRANDGKFASKPGGGSGKAEKPAAGGRSSKLADIGFVLQSGRANLDIEQRAMNAVGAETLGELARKLKAGSDEDINRVHAIVSESEAAQQVAWMKKPAAEKPNEPSTPVHAWAAKRFDNPEHAKAFVDWFGDSKITDKNGAPLVVYHGTADDFTEFKTGGAGRATTQDSKLAFFTTDDPDVADEWTWKGGDKTGSIMPLFIRMSNPYVVEGEEFYNPRATKAAIEKAKAEGHDGVIFKNQGSLSGRSTHYAFFHPSQVKSASGNRGTFDPSDNRITFSADDAEQFAVKPARGQTSLNWDEQKHPRESDGQFAPKGGGSVRSGDDDGGFSLGNDRAKRTAGTIDDGGKQRQKTLLSGLDALAGQQDLFDDMDKEPEEPEAAQLPAKPEPTHKTAGEAKGARAKRSRQNVTFDKPIVGPSGASLHSYDWRWQWESGGEEERRVSDWEDSERNEHTGRDVVHVFNVTDSAGKPHTTSLETALKLLGFAGSEGGKVRGLAHASMELAAARQLHSRLLASDSLDEVNKAPEAAEDVKRLEKRVKQLTHEASLVAAGRDPVEHYRTAAGQLESLRQLFHTSPGTRGMWQSDKVDEIAKAAGKREQSQAGKLAYHALAKALERRPWGDSTAKTVGHGEESPARLRKWFAEHGEKLPQIAATAAKWLKAHHPGFDSLPDEVKALAEDPEQFAAEERWITIGANKAAPKGKKGGTPVKVRGGKIVAGPEGLKGQHLSKIADRDTGRLATAVREHAKHWRVNKRDLLDAANEVYQQKREAHEMREAAKKKVRETTGLTQQDVSRLANSGRDHTAVPGFDAAARAIAAEFPELGLGPGVTEEGGYDDTDYASAVWQLLAEGKRELPARHSPELLDEAAALAVENKRWKRMQRMQEADAVPFAADDSGPGSGASADVLAQAKAVNSTVAAEVRRRLGKLLGKD